MQINFESIGAIAAIVAGLVAYFQYRDQVKATTMNEGKRQQEHDQLVADLAEARSRIARLEDESQQFKVDTMEIKTDVKHILKALDAIEKKIDARSDC